MSPQRRSSLPPNTFARCPRAGDTETVGSPTWPLFLSGPRDKRRSSGVPACSRSSLGVSREDRLESGSRDEEHLLLCIRSCRRCREGEDDGCRRNEHASSTASGGGTSKDVARRGRESCCVRSGHHAHALATAATRRRHPTTLRLCLTMDRTGGHEPRRRQSMSRSVARDLALSASPSPIGRARDILRVYECHVTFGRGATTSRDTFVEPDWQRWLLASSAVYREMKRSNARPRTRRDA